MIQRKRRIGILGGGPSALFIFKRLLETGETYFTVDVFEAGARLGPGMPYSREGANLEHITNVSGNEIPDLPTSMSEWLKTLPQEKLDEFGVDRNFSEYKVFPRLLFGEYLAAQFELLLEQAARSGIETTIHLKTEVADVADDREREIVLVKTAAAEQFEFDTVVICTGHNWPRTQEGTVAGYFDSPYPPAKLALRLDHAVAIRGSSLTAIDAIRTLARQNGTFVKNGSHSVSFHPYEDAQNFKLVMHSRNGLLPAIRFHLDDPHFAKESLLTPEDLAKHMRENGGFLSLDFIFDEDFKKALRDKDPSFYESIKGMNLEEFVEAMMEMRERADPFLLFKGEYEEAQKSIERKRSVYWKEMLALLSFAMNYPAKHLSAEDMHRLQTVLMPLISIVIAFVPQSSCEEMMALHDAGRLELISVGDDGRIETNPDGGITYHRTDDSGASDATQFATYVDCIGQRHLSLDEFPFQGLVRGGSVVGARLKFRSAERARDLMKGGKENIEQESAEQFYLKVPGIAITDHFQAIDTAGVASDRIYVMAVPYIGGYNPDYSGLDFGEEASRRIALNIFPHSADRFL